MIAYKGFDLDLCCTNKFQYEVGKTYELDGKPEMCKHGFHACLCPLDVFDYYGPGARYCKVDVGGTVLHSGDDSKVCASRITILEELDYDGMWQEMEDYLAGMEPATGKYANSKKQIHNVQPGLSYSKVSGRMVVAGGFHCLVEAEDGIAIAYGSSMAKTGTGLAKTYDGIALAGNFGYAVATMGTAKAGNQGTAVTCRLGNGIARSGIHGRSIGGLRAESGEFGLSHARMEAVTGYGGVAMVTTPAGRAKGGMGALLVFTVRRTVDPDVEARGYAAMTRTCLIDGKEWLPDTWYCMDETGTIKEYDSLQRV